MGVDVAAAYTQLEEPERTTQPVEAAGLSESRAKPVPVIQLGLKAKQRPSVIVADGVESSGTHIQNVWDQKHNTKNWNGGSGG